MKSFLSVALVLAALVSSINSFADGVAADSTENSGQSCRASFWQDVRALVEGCSEKISDKEQKDPIKLRSDCHDIRVQGSVIYFNLYKEKFIATVMVSDFADGDDLYDVLAQSTQGNCVAELKNVPAYGDPLAALAGGRR